jgi:hypothetical protein
MKRKTQPSIKVKTLHNLLIAIMLILNSPLQVKKKIQIQ